MGQIDSAKEHVSKLDFITAVLCRLGKYADEVGDVLYSGLETLRPGTYYFMGINPGGKANGLCIRETVHKTDDGFCNQYVDDCWRGLPAGTARAQHGARKLFRKLCDVDDSHDPIRHVLCTNLIFRTASEEGDLHPNEVNSCWSVHAYMLDIVMPKVIITYGKLPFDVVADHLGLNDSSTTCAMWGNWKLCAARKSEYSGSTWEERVTLIGLPHLSRYSPWSRPERAKHVFDFIKDPFNSRFRKRD